MVIETSRKKEIIVVNNKNTKMLFLDLKIG